jgi:hypothetical protein
VLILAVVEDQFITLDRIEQYNRPLVNEGDKGCSVA